jgi:hypothetical protein
VLLVVWCVITRKIDRWFAGGFVVLTLACIGIWQLVGSEAWDSIASMIA